MRMKLLPLCLLASVHITQAADISGTWSFRVIRFGEESGATRIVLKLDEDKVAGQLSDDIKLEGTFQGDGIVLRGTRLTGQPWATLEGRLVGDELSGSARINGEDATWRARRLLASVEPPQTRRFDPSV